MPDVDRIALAPEGTREWLGEAVEQGGATIVEAADANGLVWTAVSDADGLARPARRTPADRVGAASLGRHRAVRGGRALPRGAHLDLRQGRVRGAGGRARAGAGAGRPAPGRALRPVHVVVARHGRQPPRRPGGGARRRRASPRACCACWVRSAATSPSFAGRPGPMDGARRVVGAEDGSTTALEGATLVVLALALTPETEGDPRPASARAPRPRRLGGQRRPRCPHRHRRPRRGARRGPHRRRGARRHRPGAAARRAPALVGAALHHHAAHRQHASRWRSRCSASGCARTCAAASTGSVLLGLVDPAAGY